MSKSKISTQGLEINIVYGCNLKCEYCTHLGKYLQGVVSVEEIIAWYVAWHQKIKPRLFTVLGGEPLLHPDLADILYATKAYWNESEIQLITNGLLLPRISENVWDSLRETGILVQISQHFVSQDYLRKYEKMVRLLEEHHVLYRMRPSHTWWMKSYQLDESEQILPYASNPEIAWNNCFVKHRCMTLMNGMIYKCPQIACFTHAYKTGLLSEDWRFLLEYVPLSPSANEEEIIDFLAKESVLECRLCPEVFEMLDFDKKHVSSNNPIGERE